MRLSLLHRTTEYRPLFAWFCLFTLIWISLLLFAGGVTTSIDAGMAFLDWPLSNGSVNPDGWTKDPEMRAEHSHRLLGMILGNLCIILVIWTQWREERVWVRRLAIALLLLVIFQGLLGGARVLFDVKNQPEFQDNALAQGFAVLHALGAMATLCLWVSLTVASSRWWIERRFGLKEKTLAKAFWWGLGLCGMLFVQILLGAIIRHKNVGLAIDSFPHSTPAGDWLPAYWNWAVVLNLGHRLGVVVITVFLLGFAVSIWRNSTTRTAFGWIIFLPIALTVLQILLGAQVIWSNLNAHAATAHHLVGAFLLAACWWITFACFRPRLA